MLALPLVATALSGVALRPALNVRAAPPRANARFPVPALPPPLAERAAMLRQAVTTKTQHWPSSAKDGFTLTKRRVVPIVLGSFIASLVIVLALPSRVLAKVLLGVWHLALPAKALAGLVKVPLIPINFALQISSCIAMAAPFWMIKAICLLTASPLIVAKRFFGVTKDQAVYNILAAVPRRVQRIQSAIGASVQNTQQVVAGMSIATFAWILAPFNEEIVYRGLMQGGLRRLAKNKAVQGSGKNKRRAVFLLVALSFGASHIENLKPLVQAIAQCPPGEVNAIVLRNIGSVGFKVVVFSILLQFVTTSCASYLVFSPVCLRSGLVASMAAHVTWNVLAPIVTILFTATILMPLAQVFPQLASLISQLAVVTSYFAAKVAAPALAKMAA
jgi:membrane protease YdiL (CAAX protease family)